MRGESYGCVICTIVTWLLEAAALQKTDQPEAVGSSDEERNITSLQFWGKAP